MASASTLVLGSLIDEALDYAHRYVERPTQAVIGADAITSTSDGTITMAAGAKVPAVTDVLEFNQELMLVTGVSSDATPIVTVSRGYLNTTKNASVTTGATGWINPMYPRYQVSRAVQRCFLGLNSLLPCIISETYFRQSGKQYVVIPENTVQVLRLSYMNTSTSLFGAANTYRLTDVGGWEFQQDMPTNLASGLTTATRFLRIPAWIPDDMQLIVTRQIAYTWSATPPTETDTIQVPLGADDLPVLFAAARLVTGREISRSEIDKIEEWNEEASLRGGVNLRLLSMLWNDYYHRVQECKDLQYVPKMRPYRKMQPLPIRKPVLVR